MSEIINHYFGSGLEIKSLPYIDHRGEFINLYRSNEETFINLWGGRKIAQINLSMTKKIGTIRGLHYQKKPSKEAKLVRCLKGKVWDVAVDLRLGSKTYTKWFATELCSKKANALLIPEGFGHGFQVLEENSEILYLHSDNWIPELEAGIRWNDPTLNIKWPLKLGDISERDSKFPLIR